MNIDPALLQQTSGKLFQTIGSFNLPGGLVFSPSYLQAGLIVLCLFLLILTFAMLKHRYIHWTIKGIMPGVTLGFVLALFIEAMLVVSGRTVFTELVGWKNAPKPISNVLEASRSRLIDVLGISDVPKVEELMQSYENLEKSEQDSLQELICPR
jgi:hypothetical protein